MEFMQNTHENRILDQFTKQSKSFTNVAAHSSEDSLRLLLDMAEIGSNDVVLDAACGPGIVTSEIARRARHVTGIDIVPAMIEQAKERAAKLNQSNVEWEIGSIDELRFPENRFSVVITRYSFHHLVNPREGFQEMVRVCQPGGRVVVCDVTPDAEKSNAYDQIEILRDSSHVHALSIDELSKCAEGLPVRLVRKEKYLLPIPLEEQLAASFTPHTDEIRKMIAADLDQGRLGVNAEWRKGEIWNNLPISILVWDRV